MFGNRQTLERGGHMVWLPFSFKQERNIMTFLAVCFFGSVMSYLLWEIMSALVFIRSAITLAAAREEGDEAVND